MSRPTDHALAMRQAQWDAFHRWERSRPARPISDGERVAWYIAAHGFTRSSRLEWDSADFLEKVKRIQAIRKGMAHLRRTRRGG